MSSTKATRTPDHNAEPIGIGFSSIIATPVITIEKLQGSTNYFDWVDSIELWFMGQGYKDHLKKGVDFVAIS